MYNLHVYSRMYRLEKRDEDDQTTRNKHVIHALYRRDTYRNSRDGTHEYLHVCIMYMHTLTQTRVQIHGHLLTRAGNRKFIFYGEL